MTVSDKGRQRGGESEFSGTSRCLSKRSRSPHTEDANLADKTKGTEMTTAYFTFGQEHAHRVGGFTYDKNVVVKITAHDPRQVMFDTFGPKWAMQYQPHEIDEVFMRYFPRGVKELNGSNTGVEGR